MEVSGTKMAIEEVCAATIDRKENECFLLGKNVSAGMVDETRTANTNVITFF